MELPEVHRVRIRAFHGVKSFTGLGRIVRIFSLRVFAQFRQRCSGEPGQMLFGQVQVFAELIPVLFRRHAQSIQDTGFSPE